jgi:quercetin dioxygenase-like cupin family protein
MKIGKLKEAKKGWFIGNFCEAAYRTPKCEVALKIEKKGERVRRHKHQIAAEITLVVEGRVRINDQQFKKGDIIIIEPKEAADYEVLEDAVTVIVKVPSVANDKYYVRGEK